MDGMKLDLTDLETYKVSCLSIAEKLLNKYRTIAEIEADQDTINAYPHLDNLSEPKGIFIMEDEIGPSDRNAAITAVLEGRVFWEHTAAGEATRLKMGTKYLIAPHRVLSPETMAAMLSDHYDRPVPVKEVMDDLEIIPDQLLPLDLGTRHMLQLAFDLKRLAESRGLDPNQVLKRQKMLLILNEKTADPIVNQVIRAGFWGFSADNFFFMVQPSFPGINLEGGHFFFDETSEKRLHNHGQLVMQETMDHQIFRVNKSGTKEYLPADRFGQALAGTLDKISYNIEDLDYLTGAIDQDSLALALKLEQQGYRMVMEIVANDPDNPQKGGIAAYDQVLQRNVVIESYRLKGLPNKEIRFLNKNFNHYTNPLVSWQALKNEQLPMPILVKDDRIYFQPIQGDISYLVKTALVRRRVIQPIKAWKSAANTVTAVNAMAAQDRQPGFSAFVAPWMAAAL